MAEIESKRAKVDESSLGELCYFVVMAKGLQLAIIAEASGLPWKGSHPTPEQPWPTMKASGSTPFGQLPILKTPSGLVIGQSIAIANYIGKKASMHGATDEEFALSQMCMAEGEDLYSLLLKHEYAMWKKPEVRASKAAEQKILVAETLPTHFAHLEKLCGANGFTSSGTTVGELYLFGIIWQTTRVSGMEILGSFPKLGTWFAKTAALPAVVKVFEGESAMGPMKQCKAKRVISFLRIYLLHPTNPTFYHVYHADFLNDADYAAYQDKK